MSAVSFRRMGKCRTFTVTWWLLIMSLLTVDLVSCSRTGTFEPVTSHHRSVGNSSSSRSSPRVIPGSVTAASELYARGVRAGFYLSALGMLFLTLSPRYGRGRGLKVACGSIALSILVPWGILARKKLVSPCESYLTLVMISIVIFPARMTLFSHDTAVGEGLGLLLMMVTEAWVSVAIVWTMALGVDILPLLATDNVVFFFARVTLTGWFRWFFLVLSIFNLILTLRYLNIIRKMFWCTVGLYIDGTEKPETGEVEKGWTAFDNLCRLLPVKLVKGVGDKFETLEFSPELRRCGTFVSAVVRSVAIIVAVEITIRWNHLKPSNNMQVPGQLIPFIIGLIVFLDGILFWCHPLKPQVMKRMSLFNSDFSSTGSQPPKKLTLETLLPSIAIVLLVLNMGWYYMAR